MKLLVTGATGFVGLNFLHHLPTDEYQPIALVRDSSPVELLPSNVQTLKADLLEPDDYREELETVDAVVHLGAVYGGYSNDADASRGVDWELMKRVNVEGTRTLYEEANKAGVDRFVFTATIYAHPQIPFDRENDYVKSKEMAVEAIEESDSTLGCSILYPTVIIGPYDYRLARYNMFQMVECNRVLAPPLYPIGGINFVDSRDTARAIEHCLTESGHKKHVLARKNLSIRDFHNRISSVSERNCLVLPMPFGSTLGPIAADLADRMGLLPVSPDQLEFDRKSGVIPSKFEGQSPVQQRSMKETIESTLNCYSSIGAL